MRKRQRTSPVRRRCRRASGRWWRRRRGRRRQPSPSRRCRAWRAIPASPSVDRERLQRSADGRRIEAIAFDDRGRHRLSDRRAPDRLAGVGAQAGHRAVGQRHEDPAAARDRRERRRRREERLPQRRAVVRLQGVDDLVARHEEAAIGHDRRQLGGIGPRVQACASGQVENDAGRRWTPGRRGGRRRSPTAPTATRRRRCSTPSGAERRGRAADRAAPRRRRHPWAARPGGARGGPRRGLARLRDGADIRPHTSAARAAEWATNRPATTKSLWRDAHRPPDLVRSTGGTSI